MIPVRCEGLAAAGDLFPETTAIAVDRALRRRRERAERQFRVRDDTELSRIVAADLRLVGVNVNQARWRNREGEARIPRARVRFGETRADSHDHIRGAAPVIGDRRAPESGLPEQQRVIVPQAAFAHQRMRDRHVERLGQRCQLRGRPGREHAATRVQDRTLGGCERVDDLPDRCGVDRGPRHDRGHVPECVDGQIGGEDVHRHVDEHRTWPASLRQMERALHDARQILHAVDAVHALAKRPVDLELVGVLMEIDLLVGVAAVVVRRDIAGNHHHRDRIERRVGDAGARVGQSRTEVRQQHAGPARRARVAVGGMGRDLLVARRHEPDAALPERVEQRDDRVTAQAENHLDAEAFEILGQEVRGDPGLCRLLSRIDGVGRNCAHTAIPGGG